MIHIDDLSIELPAELGDRAERIARLVREKSAGLLINYQKTGYQGTNYPGTNYQEKMDTMALADIEIKAPVDDNKIAERIVSLIEQSLKERG